MPNKTTHNKPRIRKEVAMLCIDFETHGECKLGSGGTNGDCYSRHESTEVLCLAGTFDGKEEEGEDHAE